MACASKKTRLLIVGVHLDSDAYPNTRYRLRDLKASAFFDVSEINMPMWQTGPQSHRSIFSLCKNAWRMMFAHVVIIFRLMLAKRPEVIYVPYPAVFVLFLMSFLPSRLLPKRVIADIFISIYDTVVNDRRLLKVDGWPASMLKKMEARAYHFATTLIVDTSENAQFLRDLFDLSSSQVKAIPLSTDESHFQIAPYTPRAGICSVLFIGTMVPLHGIETILDAAALLSGRKDIFFRLFGDGQDSGRVESWTRSKNSTLEWNRKWQTSEAVARKIREADICLGIFGAGPKTQRVCPFKIYAYASVGRPIITGDTDWTRATTTQLTLKPFATVKVNNAQALADKIVELADNVQLRKTLATNSASFYAAVLSNRGAMEALCQCLLEG